MIKKLIAKFWCLVGLHDWTCAAEEGVKPTPEQISRGVVGFMEYAKGYCKNCGKILKPWLEDYQKTVNGK